MKDIWERFLLRKLNKTSMSCKIGPDKNDLKTTEIKSRWIFRKQQFSSSANFDLI